MNQKVQIRMNIQEMEVSFVNNIWSLYNSTQLISNIPIIAIQNNGIYCNCRCKTERVYIYIYICNASCVNRKFNTKIAKLFHNITSRLKIEIHIYDALVCRRWCVEGDTVSSFLSLVLLACAIVFVSSLWESSCPSPKSEQVLPNSSFFLWKKKEKEKNPSWCK